MTPSVILRSNSDEGSGCLEESLQRGLVALAGLAEEPADGLVDEVVWMVEEDVGDGKGVVQLAVADEGHRAHDADALLPDGAAVTCQVVQQRVVLVQQPFAKERVAAEVYQVPIVDEGCVGEVEGDAAGADRFFASLRMTGRMLRMTPSVILRSDSDEGSHRVLEYLHQGQQGGKADLVIFGGDALFQLFKIHLPPAASYDLPRYGDLDSQELIALAVLAGAGLEEAGEACDLRRVGMSEHL